jgi:cytochrome c oxidase cbb3-type subunit I/II
MPSYPHLYEWTIDYGEIQDRIDALAMLGNPYSKAALDDAPGLARKQAKIVADELAAQGGPTGVENKEVIALIAYIQRLGTDIKKATPAAAPAVTASAERAPGGK